MGNIISNIRKALNVKPAKKIISPVIVSGLTLTMAAVVFISYNAQAASDCISIIHRAHHADYDEETSNAIRESLKWGWGPELDARTTSDCAVVMVHDDTLKRIIGDSPDKDKADWKPEEHTLAELRAITLDKGGQIATAKEALRTVAESTKYLDRNPKAKVMIELKRWQDYSQKWIDCDGVQTLNDWITYYGLGGRAFLGGTPGATNHIRDNYPDRKLFWRVEVGDTVTPQIVTDKEYKLVQLPPEQYGKRSTLENAGIQGLTVSTRNVLSDAEIKTAYDAGFRTFQTNYGAKVNNFCNNQ
jgi:glycerophosphoryl diester phosphodiesterase